MVNDKYKVLILCFSVFLMGGLEGLQAQDAPVLTPQMDSLTERNSEVWVDIQVGTQDNQVQDLFGVSFVVMYDTANVEIVDDSEGSFLGSDVVYFSEDEPDKEQFALSVSRKSGQGTVDGTGVVASVKIKVDSTTELGSLLSLSTADISANDSAGNSISLSPDTAVTRVAGENGELPSLTPGSSDDFVRGDTTTLNITAGSEDAPVSDLFGVSYVLSYDTSHVRVVNDEAGAFLGSDVVYFSNDEPSKQQIAISVSRKSGQGGVDGSGTVAQVDFAVDTSDTAGTPLQFTTADVNANDPDGNTVYLEPDTANLAIEPALIYGDVTEDGTISAFDAARVLQHVVGNLPDPFTDNQREAANVSDDDSVTAYDASLILQKVTHPEYVFPVLQQSKSSDTFLADEIAPSELPELSWGETRQTGEDNSFEIPVKLTGDTEYARSVQLSIKYDSRAMTVTNFTPASPENWMVEYNVEEEKGRIQLAMSGLDDINEGAIAHLQWKVKDDASQPALRGEGFINENPEQHFEKVAVEDETPNSYKLLQNYPNPFNPVTNIRYHLPGKTHVTMEVYNITGKKVTTLVNRKQEAGRYQIKFEADDLPSGIYIYQLSADGFTRSQKMMLVK